MAKNRHRPRHLRRWAALVGSRLADWARHSLVGLGIAGGLAGLGVAGWAVIQRAPYFNIRVVEAEESAHLDRATIVALVGLESPVNLFRFDAVAAEEALAAHPWVATARIVERLPDRVEIHHTERQPAAVVSLGGLYVVDADGQPFIRTTPAAAKGLPLVTGLEREAYEADPAAARASVRDALALVRLYERGALASAHPLSNVHVGEGGRLELMLGKTRVVMGRGDYKAKLERLAEIYQTLARRSMEATYVLMDESGQRSIVKEVPVARPMMGAL